MTRKPQKEGWQKMVIELTSLGFVCTLEPGLEGLGKTISGDWLRQQLRQGKLKDHQVALALFMSYVTMELKRCRFGASMLEGIAKEDWPESQQRAAQYDVHHWLRRDLEDLPTVMRF